MTTKFSDYRHKLNNGLTPLVKAVQEQLDAAGETDVTAYDLLLEVTIKVSLPELGRSRLASVLREYAELIAGDLLTVAMSTDEMPKLE